MRHTLATGVLTADPSLGADVGELFNLLTGSSKQQTHRSLLVAPLDMQRKLIAKIEREIVRQRETGNGHLIFKCNGLTDEEMTAALYRASQAGVRVDLLVRGVCSVRMRLPVGAKPSSRDGMRRPKIMRLGRGRWATPVDPAKAPATSAAPY